VHREHGVGEIIGDIIILLLEFRIPFFGIVLLHQHNTRYVLCAYLLGCGIDIVPDLVGYAVGTSTRMIYVRYRSYVIRMTELSDHCSQTSHQLEMTLFPVQSTV